MKPILLLIALAATGPCSAQPTEPADAPAAAASAALAFPKDRCPPPPLMPKVAVPSGDYSFKVHTLIKADGSVGNVRVEGRGARDFKRIIAKAFDGYRCLPAEADQEYQINLKLGTRLVG